MTVQSTNNRNNYVGNDTTETYNYTFRVFLEDDLSVVVTNTTTEVDVALTKTTDYTVTGVTDDGGGTIVLVDAGQDWISASSYLDTGFDLSVRRVVELKQETDIRNQGDFYPEVHEDVFDKLTMADQQQQDEVDRSIKLPESVDPATFEGDMPVGIAGTPNVTLITNSSGDGWDVGPTAAEISSAQGYAVAAEASKDAAETAQTAAETAQTGAETAETGAETAETNAETAQTAAEAAQAAAELAAASATALKTFADDAAYVTDKGSAAAEGDFYSNTTLNKIRFYNGTAWRTVEDVLNKYDATVAPDADNDIDEGYVVGSKWVDTTADNAYICADNTDGAAVWLEISPGATPNLAVTSKTGTYTAASGDDVILCATAGGAFSLTLPAAASNTGKQFHIVKTDASTNLLTIDGNASETIDGSLTQVLSNQWQSYKIVSDGTNWVSLSSRRYPTAFIKDLKPSNTAGGATSTNTVHIRILNDLSGETGFVSLASNQFTLGPGTYNIDVITPVYKALDTQLFLYNTTDASYDIEGMGYSSGITDYRFPTLTGSFTITATKVFEIRHWVAQADGNGFGFAANGTNNPQTTEVYTQVEITKVL